MNNDLYCPYCKSKHDIRLAINCMVAHLFKEVEDIKKHLKDINGIIGHLTSHPSAKMEPLEDSTDG